ncbi:MAG: nitroreductase family protein [Oscillospiraceae bacterium]|nr:nitroreductase family protein [Oscillospiraceae bacterium]
MNETIKNIMQRNSCRDFEAAPLTDAQVKTLVEAALAAPSAQNLQPWHVTVVTDKKFIEEMDSSGMEAMAAMEDKMYYNRIKERGGKLFYNAPCIVVISTSEAPWAPLDSGIQCQNVVLAAEAMGLGSCIVGLLRVPLDGPKGGDFKKRLKFPDGYDFAVSILVGTVKTGKEPHELDFGKVDYV